MHILYAQQNVDPDASKKMFAKGSIFLAGPTLRSFACMMCEGTGSFDGPGNAACPRCRADVKYRERSWRADALQLLEAARFEGTALVPEYGDRDRVWNDWDWDAQVEWEMKWLTNATCIAFWIPREMRHLPGLTTNVEFGYWARDAYRVVLGFPKHAVHTRYLEYIAKLDDIPVVHTLEETIALAVARTRR